MRILLFVLSLFLLCSCGNGKLRIPPQPAILGLAFPVYLQSDTAVVRLSDYFSQPEQIKRITPPKGTESEEINDKSILKLRINGPGSPLQNLRIRYEGYNYDIPAISGDSGIRIMTDKLKGDTIYLLSSVPAVHWVVYLQNYMLSDKALLTSGDRLGIVIPLEASRSQWAELRVWAFNENGVSNDILLPLRKGQVVTDVSELLMVNHSGTDLRSQYPLNVANSDYAASVFALCDKSFRQLHDSLTNGFWRYSVYRNLLREDHFLANAGKTMLNMDTVYKWILCIIGGFNSSFLLPLFPECL